MISIIWTTYSVNDERAELARKSLESLIATTQDTPCEILVIDNGGSLEESAWYLEKVHTGSITHYIRNADNLWFGYARNQGLTLSSGEFIVISDNDILFQQGWLKECISVLKNTNKLLITPLEVDRAHLQSKYFVPPVIIEGERYQINTLAGSSCWAMKRSDFYEIGLFKNHPIAGTKWCQTYSKKGYAVVILPQPKAAHFGIAGSPYEGYNKKKGYVAKKRLTCGEQAIFDTTEKTV